jgi:hypothetical protein
MKTMVGTPIWETAAAAAGNMKKQNKTLSHIFSQQGWQCKI